ncbi:SprT family protein [Lentilactobacillus sp. Marseille-Q4993]|uniref:SprT family protein n=1 Tax=Lentilactobacillus sp. Marseille-Q4993 TaxID=3039492 RepID=UPI0024BC13FD|nr:SprT family protein [Lentilactobacillus sp. Marseille-Q4993]
MENKELQRLVEQISVEYFAKPFSHKARFNGRLRTTGGRYILQSHDIEINPKMVANFSQDVLVGIVKHELCHYHLHLAGKTGKHNTKEFQTLLKAVGGSRYAPAVPKPSKYQYVCSECGLIYKRQRKINTKRYVCGRCHGKLELVEINN